MEIQTKQHRLGGGLKHFLFSLPTFGKMMKNFACTSFLLKLGCDLQPPKTDTDLGDLGFGPPFFGKASLFSEDHTLPHGFWIGMAPALPSGTLEVNS